MRRGRGDERERIEVAVRRFCERHGLLPESGRVVVAVSGGADSSCLLGALDSLCGPGKLLPEVELVVAHLDHGLRGADARADAAWVAELAAQLGWRSVQGTAEVAHRAANGPRGDSTAQWRGIEDAARRARYRFLRSVARDEGATRICVGHTADDQAETLILNWLRGSGLTGLTGMRPLAGGIARPLLGLRRGDTHAYCASRGWQPRTDETNTDDRFARNRVRHQLLPTLKQFNPNLVPTLVRNADLLAEDESYLEATAADALEELAGSVTEDEVALDGSRLLALPAALRRRVVRQAAALLMGGPADGPSRLDARHIALVAALAATHSAGSAVELPGGLVATAERERVVLRRRQAVRGGAADAATGRAQEAVPLAVPGSVELPEMGWRVRALLLDATAGAVPPGMEVPRAGGAGGEGGMAGDAADAGSEHEGAGVLTPAAGTAADAGRAHLRAYLDADAAGEPLWVRGWRPGDRFQPLGMTGKRKLQDFFVDAKVPRDERGRIPLVWGPRHLLWIAGHRIDERARLRETTQRVLALRLEPLDFEAEREDVRGAEAGEAGEAGEIVEIWEANPGAVGFGEAPEGGGSGGTD